MRSAMFSSPGKLMLFGEHAVLHGSGCIVLAVDQRMRVRGELLDEQVFVLNAPDVHVPNYKKLLSELGKGDIPKGAKFVEIAVTNFLCHPEFISGSHEIPKQVRNDKFGIKISTSSEFSSEFGFGSSSASVVCTLKALSELFSLSLSNKELFDLAYKTVLDIQGKGSGFDIAAAIYGGTLYFEAAGKVIEPLNIKLLPLVVGYSGVKADTVSMINQVGEKKKVFNKIAKVVNDARKALEKEDWKTTGELMNRNQELLKDLGVSTKKLDNMISSAIDAGAYGAKLSGAGGGDCMIALVSDEKREGVEKAIVKAGGQVIDAMSNAEGVRIEV